MCGLLSSSARRLKIGLHEEWMIAPSRHQISSPHNAFLPSFTTGARKEESKLRRIIPEPGLSACIVFECFSAAFFAQANRTG